MTRAEEAEAELSASRAEVVALREALEEAARRFEGLSHIHDGNPSDAMADMPPLDYARHMLWEARRECREGAREARAALAGEKPVGAGVDLLAELTKRPCWELTHGPIDPDWEGGELGWCVTERSGNINDREWTLIASGETPADALRAALSKSGEKP